MINTEGNVTGSIESIALDWMSDSLYWVDANKKTIEVAKSNGHHRRVLIDNKNDSRMLERPRAIVVNPKFG